MDHFTEITRLTERGKQQDEALSDAKVELQFYLESNAPSAVLQAARAKLARQGAAVQVTLARLKLHQAALDARATQDGKDLGKDLGKTPRKA